MITLDIKVTPNASKARIVWDDQQAIKCYVQAPAVEGKANDAVIDLIAKKLGIGRRSVSIKNGEKNRFKTLVIETTLSHDEVLRLLGLETQASLV